jgi:hypothetical protein
MNIAAAELFVNVGGDSCPSMSIILCFFYAIRKTGRRLARDRPSASTRSVMGKRFDPGWMIATMDSPRSPRADVKINQAINDFHGIPGMSAAPIPVTNGAAFGFNW